MSEQKTKDDIWTGEQDIQVEHGGGHVEDGGLVYYDAFDEDGFGSYVIHSTRKSSDACVAIGNTFDDGEIDLGLMVHLRPSEARRLGELLIDAADYEDQDQ